MKGINKACRNSKVWDETGQTYEQTDFFSKNILMEKSFWIFKKLIMERLILGIKYEQELNITPQIAEYEKILSMDSILGR